MLATELPPDWGTTSIKLYEVDAAPPAVRVWLSSNTSSCQAALTVLFEIEAVLLPT